MPRERFELSTPGLQDQCSNHWANEADTLVFKIDKTNKQRSKQKPVAYIDKMNCWLRILMNERTDSETYEYMEK